jgi:hypothetical protein
VPMLPARESHEAARKITEPGARRLPGRYSPLYGSAVSTTHSSSRDDSDTRRGASLDQNHPLADAVDNPEEIWHNGVWWPC